MRRYFPCRLLWINPDEDVRVASYKFAQQAQVNLTSVSILRNTFQSLDWDALVQQSLPLMTDVERSAQAQTLIEEHTEALNTIVQRYEQSKKLMIECVGLLETIAMDLQARADRFCDTD